MNTLLARKARERLGKHRGLYLARFQRRKPLLGAGEFLDHDVVAGEPEAFQRKRRRDVALRAKIADRNCATLQVGRAPHAGRGEEHEPDLIAKRADQPQVAARAVDPDDVRKAPVDHVEPAVLQGFEPAVAVAEHDFDAQAMLHEEAALLRHPPCKIAVGAVGDTGLECDRLGGGRRCRRCNHERGERGRGLPA